MAVDEVIERGLKLVPVTIRILNNGRILLEFDSDKGAPTLVGGQGLYCFQHAVRAGRRLLLDC